MGFEWSKLWDLTLFLFWFCYLVWHLHAHYGVTPRRAWDKHLDLVLIYSAFLVDIILHTAHAWFGIVPPKFWGWLMIIVGIVGGYQAYKRGRERFDAIVLPFVLIVWGIVWLGKV